MEDRGRIGITRRDFLRRSAAGAALAGTASAWTMEAAAAGEEASRSTVVLVRDTGVLGPDRSVIAEVAERMLDAGVRELTGKPDADAAWAEFVKPSDTVGVKSNTWPALPTPKEVEAVIVRRLTEAGVAADKVAVEDRGARANPVFQNSTALINVRPMRSHHWAGVGSCIKNYMPFCENPPSLHDNSCANLGQLWELPMVKGKTRLNILVMFTPLFHSKGPHNFDAKYTWEYGGLLFGTDPVAVDSMGLAILEAKRRDFFDDDQPFPIPPHHIRFAAEQFHLGIADRTRIDLKKLGTTDGMLI